MKSYPRIVVSLSLSLLIALIVSSFAMRAPRAAAQGSTDAREQAYRANNLGVALLEQFKHKEGAEAFRAALKLQPQLAMARINLAIALFNVPDLAGAQREAEAAAASSPQSPQPHYVLGLIAKSQNRADDAVKHFQRVLQIDARDTGANVQLGQLHAQARKYTEAAAAFRVALDAEPYNGTALYNLATAQLRAGQREEGQRLMARFQELRQSGAATVVGTNYLEQGRYAEAVTSTGAEADLVDRKTPSVSFKDATASVLPATTKSSPAVPSSTNSPSVNYSGAPLFGRPFIASSFDDAAKRELASNLGGGATLFDFDSDGDLDLLDVQASTQRLLRNDGGKFVDVTAQSGALAKESNGVGIGAVAGDFDNDEKPDVFVLRYGASSLYRNEGGGRFNDATAAAGISYPHLSISAAFVDADHDGDLDIFIAGLADLSKPPAPTGVAANSLVIFPTDFARAPNTLFRNNGNGTFTDVTSAAKLATPGHAVAVVPTDYDNRRDVDLLVVNYDALPTLYRNLRDASFRDVAAEVGLSAVEGPHVSAAAGDVNKDGFTDFYFGGFDMPGHFALSDGRGRFKIQPSPAAPGDITNAGLATHAAAQFLDYDNDGLLDLLSVFITTSGGSVRLWRGVGGDGWAGVDDASDADELFAKGGGPQARVLASGDVDADGDVDLILRRAGGELMFARNEGGNKNRSVRVRLAGKVSNRSGVGAKVEARAGSLMQKLETYSALPAPAPADIVFGLGARASTDAVRVLWPAGIVQAETDATPGATVTARAGDPKVVPPPGAAKLTITELDRKPSSCPYLYTWNGERFEFVTDFMGGGELGYWAAPGVRAAPDPDEYVRIRGDQLKEKDGRYEIRVTNELEEALFLDHLALVAVAHPEGIEVYPNEGLGNPTSSVFKLYATRDARPPRAATDEHGHDVRARVERMDRQYPDDFKLQRIRGYAEKHALTLDLGAESNTARGARETRAESSTLLLLTGWTDYAFSSDNVAASQAGMSLEPPALQVKDKAGEWRTVIEDIGIPVGRPQTIVVDLTGKFLSSSREVRIVTNMRIYWDQILVDTSGGASPMKLTRLKPVVADLRWRGFSAEATPDGREPFGYDFARVSFASPWKTFPGRYTREGDVRELLWRTDDMFVVSRPGDAISVSFDASKLPPLARGWTRTFLLYADGYSKEMDINSASPDAVSPLPFHGMKNYPYDAPESYPSTPAHRAYVERYNTRLVAAPMQQLVNRK